MEREPSREEIVNMAAEAMEKFVSSMPDDLSNEEIVKAFEILEKTPGSGGPDLIASVTARIVEAYQNKYNMKLV